MPSGRAYAAGTTELLDESATLDQDSDNNSSNTTLFKWKTMNTSAQSTFNGKKGLSFRIKTSDGMSYDSGGTNNQIMYRDTGASFDGLLFEAVARNEGNLVQDDTGSFGSNYYIADIANGKVNIVKNYDDNSKTVEMKIVTSVSSDKKYILLDMYAYNTSASKQLLNVRMFGDTQVTGNDS